VWTRASSMHIYSQTGPNHTVIRSGGHGREIKAVAVSPDGNSRSRQLIATGAEDTDIKIFQYVEEDFICRRTIRKHTTGIQHLQWSQDGNYLFSSGGCEECMSPVQRCMSFADSFCSLRMADPGLIDICPWHWSSVRTCIHARK
jgi:WD40 repeat protein